MSGETVEIDVWAPLASAVTLLANGGTVPMRAMPEGWWVADIDAPAGDLDYGFLLDDRTDALPDPRSRWQPNGVEALSRFYDHRSFAWTDQLWTGRQMAGGVIYEMHVGTFTAEGTLDSAIGRLDHLVEVGVTHVELLPVNGFNGVHNWGYDGVLWYAVQHSYGGPAAYQRFVDACHARGIAVIQDVVYNHFGPVGNYLPQFGPYLHESGENTWGSLVNLDGEHSDQVRRYIVENALMWLRDYHVDGLRLDAVHALVDHRSVHLLEELATEVDALSAHLGRPLTLIAESDLNDPKLITPRAGNGYGLTGQWSDDFHHVVHVALTGERVGYYGDFGSMESLAKVYTSAYFHNGTWSSFRGRSHGRPIDPRHTESWRFVVYAQNHDQIGNRAAGDRLTATLSPAELALSAVLVMTSPFTPMLFMGEEWGATTPWQFFTSHTDPAIGEATAQGRFTEFARMGWDESLVPDPQDPQTFQRSKLDWNELAKPAHADLLDLYRRLAVLRRELPQLTDPRFSRTSVTYDESAQWVVLDRCGVIVVLNFCAAEQRVPFSANSPELLLSTADCAVEDIGLGACTVTLPARSAAVIASAHAVART